MINKNKNKITFKTLLMLSIMSMMLIPGGIIPVYAISGDLLLEINNPTPEASDRFGYSVATTSNGDLLVGARYDNTGATYAGSAYLFDGNDGSLLLTINNPTPEASDYFGYSVATTSNGDLLVGATHDNTGASSAGSAYLFDGTLRGTTSTPLLTINNPTPETSDYFGFSVATTSNGDLLVGTIYDNTGATQAGSAYLFDGTLRGTTSTPLLTINNPTPEASDQFGYSVATTSNGDLLVGATSDNTGATYAGSAYLFDGTLRGTTSTPLLTINNPTPEALDSFGWSVAATNTDDLLVGAYRDNTGATNAGSAYLFDGTLRGTTSTPLLTINNPTPEASDYFGWSVVATSNGDLLVGAYHDNTGATDAGSVFLFEGIPSSPPTDSTTSTEGTVEIRTTCGLQFNAGAPINYGEVFPGDTSEEQTLTLYNSGNVAGDILVSGSDWVDGTPTTQMNVDDTKYSTLTGDYASKTSLLLTDQTLITLDPQVDTDTFWQLQANLLDTLFSGSLTQTVDFSVTC